MVLTHFPFLIIGFALASVGYFALPVEPAIWLGALGLPIVFGLWLAYKTSGSRYFLSATIMTAALLTGFLWAQMRAHWVATYYAAPDFVAQQQDFNAEVVWNGEVVWRELQPRSSKWDIRLRDADGRAYIIRLYGRRHHIDEIMPGCHISFAARLDPLAGPIVIGGYDPRRDAWFRGQRGQGFLRSIHHIDCEQSIGISHRLARWRLRLAETYRAKMSKQTGPVAAALVTGVRGAIEKPVREAFRHSGLAHMLAISGLHMALFAGSVYALLRLLAAYIPRLSLYYDTRKPSAVISLCAATGYLLISGGSVATQRAFIIMAILFLAILLDRPAITMRNVLWAMLFVLLWQPHAVMQVGFQMSFAAVMALVAVYEVWQQRDGLYLRWESLSLMQQIFRRVGRYASALFLTSLIAGTVTGFLALIHFYRVGTFGLPSNLLAMPIFGTLIMPMAPLSLLLMPLGLGFLPMTVMERGIEMVLAIAQYFTSFDVAVWMPAASPAFVLPLSVSGFLCLCLLPHRRRVFGLLPIILATAFIGRGDMPSLHLFGRDLIVVRDVEHRLLQLRRRGHVYELERVEAFHGRKNTKT